MQNNLITIFNYIDQPKKYAGLTLFEIITTGLVGVVSLITDQIILGLLGCCLMLPLSKYILEKIRSCYITRFAFFHLSDLFGSEKQNLNIFSKYYL